MNCGRCGAWRADETVACPTCGAVPGSPAPTMSVPAPAPAIAATVVYGGFWRRTFGLLVDELLLFFPNAILRVRLGLDAPGGDSDWSRPIEWWALGASVLLAVLYHAVLASSPFEGTLGQRALDLRVCDGDGRRLTLARALARGVAYWLSALTCGLGLLLMLWTPRRQTLHDLICGTLVVRGAPPDRRETAGASRPVEAR